MKKLKRVLFCISVFGMNTLSLFADNGGRGRVDSGSPSDSTAILFGIFAIVVGFFLAFTLLGDNSGNKPEDKEIKHIGCAGIIAVIIGFILLIGMCSH